MINLIKAIMPIYSFNPSKIFINFQFNVNIYIL